MHFNYKGVFLGVPGALREHVTGVCVDPFSPRPRVSLWGASRCLSPCCEQDHGSWRRGAWVRTCGLRGLWALGEETGRQRDVGRRSERVCGGRVAGITTF